MLALLLWLWLMLLGRGMRRRRGLGGGKTVSLDRVTLTSRRLGLTGRPDWLIEADGTIIVEERKSSRRSWPSHRVFRHPLSVLQTPTFLVGNGGSLRIPSRIVGRLRRSGSGCLKTSENALREQRPGIAGASAKSQKSSPKPATRDGRIMA